MSNTFLTVQEIAQESLARLRNNLVFAQLVHRDYSGEFASKGDTIQVKKPATFEAKEFTTATDTQAINEEPVLVKMDKIADVTVEVTAKQLTQNIQNFGDQVVEGAMQALAQKIDLDLAKLYADIPYSAGDAGQNPAKLAHLSQARKVLNENKVPMNLRRLVVDPEADAELLVLDAIVNAEKAGTTAALREASLGRLLGMDTFMNQNIQAHVKGTAATFDVAGVAGEKTLAITTATNGHTFKKGDIITVTGVTQPFAVAADAEVAATIATVQITEAVETTFTAAAGTLKANHTGNLAFHRDAFALVNRPMALPMGGANGYVANFEGLSVRATMGYTMGSKINTISFDILYGVKTLEPKLATRVWGASS